MSTDAHALALDNARLRRELAQQTQLAAELTATVERQQQTLSQQEETIARLLRRFTGVKQERVDPRQLTLFSEDELQALARESTLPPPAAEIVPSEQPAEIARRRGHGRRKTNREFPREQRVYELSPAERTCPCCGRERCEIGREQSEQYDYQPASLKVIEHVQVKYACPACTGQVASAAKPPQPIDKGLAGPGLLAQVVLSKVGDHLPLYRQEDIFARHGLNVRRSTLCDWITAAADLTWPLYLRMCQLVRTSRVIWTDDTGVKLIDWTLGHAVNARFWSYAGDASQPYVAYDFTPSRKRDGPAAFLAGFRGYLQADAYGAYDGIYAGGDVVEVACWAHCRRYWWEARATDARRAHQALSFIARLYQLEQTFAPLSADERQAAREQHARPILADFAAWLSAEQSGVLPKSPIGQAFTYTQNQWAALGRYVEHGLLTIDNNVSERAVKPIAIGRKNWLFVASPAGGRRAAALLSLVSSCKAAHVEPWAYLRDVLTRLPVWRTAHGQELTGLLSVCAAGPDVSAAERQLAGLSAAALAELDALLPDRWLQSHPGHRWAIQDRRERERRPQALGRSQRRSR